MAESSIAIPSDPFAAYEPTPDDTWDLSKAAHLLRRVTFGATAARLDAILKFSPQQAIDSLLDYDPQTDAMGDMAERLEGLMNLDSPENVQRWWVYRMLYSPNPAQEKIALFWHGRFATSGTKVSNGLQLAKQIDLFRSEGLKSFRDLVVAISRDPAMLVWLDGQYNHRGKPNENYGRELMELFTLGVGNYTERDVQELSRCFTGWQIQKGQSTFDPKQFDDGEKEIFGQKGKFDSESAVDLILKQPAAPKFLAHRMLREFVHPHPTDEMVDYYAGQLLKENWQIKPVLKQMLGSRLFFSSYCYRSKIKSPAEIAIGGALAVGGKINVDFVRQSMNRMGQSLLFPPNVKGWDGEEAWINANTVLGRFNYGSMVATQREFAKRTDIEAMLGQLGLTTAEPIIDYYARMLRDGKLQPEERRQYMVFMSRNQKGEVGEFRMDVPNANNKVRGMIHLMMATPEFQLA